MERRTPFLYTALGLTVLIYILNFLALEHSLYWSIWWYDVPMHFLAGLTGGLSAYWVFFHSGVFFKRLPGNALTLIIVFVCVMIVGAAWEYLEYVYKIQDGHEGVALDTMNDLVLDGSGAVLAALIGLRKRNSSIPSL